jgi:hypothetical protein
MADITIPIPDDRVPEFLAHIGAWLDAPAGSQWTLKSPPAGVPVEWRLGSLAAEGQLAAAVWDELDDDQRAIVKAVERAGRIELAHLANAVKAGGAIEVAQRVRAISEVCRRQGRHTCFVFDFPGTGESKTTAIRLKPEAKLAFVRCY